MNHRIKRGLAPFLVLLFFIPVISPNAFFPGNSGGSYCIKPGSVAITLEGEFPEWADGFFSGILQNVDDVTGYILGHLKLGRRNTTGLFQGVWNSTKVLTGGQVGGIFHRGKIYGYFTITGQRILIPFIGTLYANETHFMISILSVQAQRLMVTGTHYESFLPQPTGPYRIGTDIFHLTDSSRDEEFTENPLDKRELMMQIWYPRENTSSGGTLAPYMDPPVFKWLKRQSPIPLFMIPDSAYTFVQTHAILHASPAHSAAPFPLILLSHGYDGVRSIYTSFIEDLVSHGFVVAAIDHPYIAGITVFPDGRTVELAPVPVNPEDADKYFEKSFRAVVGDIRFVIDYLANLITINGTWRNHLDVSRIGVSGHSFGGGAAAMICHMDERVTAGVALDGYFRGDVVTDGLSKPFLMMLAEDHFTRDNITQSLWENLRGNAFRAEVQGSTHYGYTDVGILLSHFTPLLPRDALGFGTISPKRLIEITNAYDHAFFDIYLKGASPEIILGLSDIYKEVDFVYKP